jgi:hypothetical protein
VFKKIIPDADQVMSLDQCMKMRIFAEGKIVDVYKKDKISFEQAMRLTSVIKHPGDRQDTRQVLIFQKSIKEQGWHPINRLTYSFFWVFEMADRSVGIWGHRIMAKSKPWIWVYLLIPIFTLIMLISQWRRITLEEKLLLAVSAGYLIVLMQYDNYQTYLCFGTPGIGLQGRYAFPVFMPLIALSAKYLLTFSPGIIRIGIAAGIGLFLIAGDFPYFLMHTSNKWHSQSPLKMKVDAEKSLRNPR